MKPRLPDLEPALATVPSSAPAKQSSTDKASLSKLSSFRCLSSGLPISISLGCNEPNKGLYSPSNRAIEIGSLVDGGADVEDAVESAGRALDLGGDESRSSDGVLDGIRAAAEEETDGSDENVLDAGDGVDLEGDAGGFTGDEIRKRNCSFQVGFWPPNRSIAVLSLAEESTQVRA